jgi:hypothetical protein
MGHLEGFAANSPKGTVMDRNTPIGPNFTDNGSEVHPHANPLNAKIEDAAQGAHQRTDKIADNAMAQVDGMSDRTHRAVDSAVDAASSAAEWASAIPAQAKQIQGQITEVTRASIRARPIATVAGVLVIGYLLGRLGRP